MDSTNINRIYEKKEKINGINLVSAMNEKITQLDHQEQIRNWIKDEIVPNLTDKNNRIHNSYTIKHMCEKDLGFYVSNYDIKYNMCMLGIKGQKVTSSKRINTPEGNYLLTTDYCYPISDIWFENKSK